MPRVRTYTEFSELDTFEDRFRYLSLGGSVAEPTFGYDRYINQGFYRSKDWRDVRYFVIDRDRSCDLGIEGYDIHRDLHVHHINPMTPSDIIQHNDVILDPEYLITTCLRTHNAIHFGDERQLPRQFVDRKSGDTQLWKRTKL